MAEDRVVVRADLDLALAAVLQAEAQALLSRDGDRPLVVDLSATPFLDSSGVQALVKVAAAYEPGPGCRVVAAGQPFEVLELTEVIELLHVERAEDA